MIITKVELIVLAGGQSRRMGQDKTRLKIGSRTLWQHALASACRFGFAVRVIRRDQLRGLGPMSGVLTALRTTRYHALIFLAADMPWISWATVRQLIREVSKIRPGIFTITGAGPGFPFALLTALLPRVEKYIASGRRSLRGFASLFADSDFAPPLSQLRGLTNLNLPCQLARERQCWKGAPFAIPVHAVKFLPTPCLQCPRTMKSKARPLTNA